MARNISNYALGAYTELEPDKTIIRKSLFDELRNNIDVVHDLGDNLDARTHTIETTHVANGITKTLGNLAKGGKPIASSFTKYHPPIKAMDNPDLKRYWCSLKTGTNAIGEFIGCIFGPYDGQEVFAPVQYRVKKIKVTQRVSNNLFISAGATGIAVWAYNGATWSAVQNFNGEDVTAAANSDKTALMLVLDTPVDAYGIRLKATGATADVYADHINTHWAVYNFEVFTADTAEEVAALEAAVHPVTTYTKSGVFDFTDKVKLDSLYRTYASPPAVVETDFPKEYLQGNPDWWKFETYRNYKPSEGVVAYRFWWPVSNMISDKYGPCKILNVLGPDVRLYVSNANSDSGYDTYTPFSYQVFAIFNVSGDPNNIDGDWVPFDPEVARYYDITYVGVEALFVDRGFSSYAFYGNMYDEGTGASTGYDKPDTPYTLPELYTEAMPIGVPNYAYGVMKAKVFLQTLPDGSEQL